jgi:hypothetical protein
MARKDLPINLASEQTSRRAVRSFPGRVAERPLDFCNWLIRSSPSAKKRTS